MTPLSKKQGNALRFIVNLLRDNNIPFWISGGFAAKVYGSKRLLNDIDIDIPDKSVYQIAHLVKPFIISGPKRYKDKLWDLHLLELNYHGQLIDLSGVQTCKIFDLKNSFWKDFGWEIKNYKNFDIDGMTLPIIPADKLIEYKSYLEGDHQKEDIKAVKEYLKKENSF
jgi:hypothetical protein